MSTEEQPKRSILGTDNTPTLVQIIVNRIGSLPPVAVDRSPNCRACEKYNQCGSQQLYDLAPAAQIEAPSKAYPNPCFVPVANSYAQR